MCDVEDIIAEIALYIWSWPGDKSVLSYMRRDARGSLIFLGTSTVYVKRVNAIHVVTVNVYFVISMAM